MPLNSDTANSVLVSVVVPTRNRSALLEKTLESLWRQTLPEDQFEVIVVDNCSTDDTVQRVKSLQSWSGCRLRLHEMEVNRGPAYSRNAGARMARGEFIAFTDSDVCLDSNWLSSTVKVLGQNPGIGAVGGKVLFSTRPDRIHSYGGDLSPIGLAWDAHEWEPDTNINELADRLWIPSAAMLIRSELFHQIGGFDEEFFYGYEDSDLGWRLNLAERCSVCIPEAVAYHWVNDTVEGEMSKIGEEICYHYCKNRLRSMLKNYSRLSLAKYLPLYMAYSLVDVILRAPRAAKMRAWMWNLAVFPDTWAKRKEIQRRRQISDSRIAHLFSPRFFPREKLQKRILRFRNLRLSRSAQWGKNGSGSKQTLSGNVATFLQRRGA